MIQDVIVDTHPNREAVIVDTHDPRVIVDTHDLCGQRVGRRERVRV